MDAPKPANDQPAKKPKGPKTRRLAPPTVSNQVAVMEIREKLAQLGMVLKGD